MTKFIPLAKQRNILIADRVLVKNTSWVDLAIQKFARKGYK